jgi:HAD superfamily hydrolase (TIGR01662 family)
VLQRWVDTGHGLFLVSNQSGIAGGTVSEEAVRAAFDRTVELLGLPVKEIAYCPHPAFPVGCFCRKPLPGLGVQLLLRHRLGRAHTIMVGDMDSDEDFARALGVKYHTAEAFFGGSAG